MKIQNALLTGLFVASGLIGCTTEKAEQKETAEAPKEHHISLQATPQKEVIETPQGDPTSIKWANPVYDFGDVKEGEDVLHTYTFTNTGEVPLIISRVKASCGCTTPTYTKAPVAPGQTGEIKVKFNSRGRSGKQIKTITVYANVENGISEVKLQGNVQKEQELNGPFKKQN